MDVLIRSTAPDKRGVNLALNGSAVLRAISANDIYKMHDGSPEQPRGKLHPRLYYLSELVNGLLYLERCQNIGNT
jgi:hypothetical protein